MGLKEGKINGLHGQMTLLPFMTMGWSCVSNIARVEVVVLVVVGLVVVVDGAAGAAGGGGG